jgi:hypothetical protein
MPNKNEGRGLRFMLIEEILHSLIEEMHIYITLLTS